MKVLPFNIPKPDSSALIYQVDKVRAFYDKLHQHEEIQISIIINGEGELMVGDSVHRYGMGDIYVIGSNIPHLFKSDLGIEGDSHMLTLFFSRDSFGRDFFEMDELKDLRRLLNGLGGGIRLLTQKDIIKNRFERLKKETKLGRFILFLDIMKLITESEKEVLTTFIHSKKYSEDQGARMSAVMQLALNEFHREISLEEVASVANMTTNAFCRFFKLRTNKTFVQLLTEIRLEHACKLLLKKRDLSIAEIADLSGFNNISNFNRKFRSYKKMKPSDYRKRF